MKDVNLETTSGYNHTMQNKKPLRKRRRACKSSWSRRRNESFTMSIPWNLENLVKVFSGIIVRQHRTDRKLMGLPRERYAGLRKGLLLYCCNQVWMRNGERIPWSATPICETFNISCLMRRHLMSGDSENHVFRLVRKFKIWCEISTREAHRHRKIHAKASATCSP